MPERGTLSIAKAQKLLGYTPQHPVEKDLFNILIGIRISLRATQVFK